MSTVVLIVVCVALTSLAYGWFEAGWLRTRVREVAIPDLPETLDGLRLGHLSDFHLGARLSRGNRATERAVAWVVERQPDIVCVTGDLVSHPRGENRLRRLLAALDRPYVVLGNHDIAVTHDPFSRAVELRDLDGAVLLRDAGETLEIGGERIGIVGLDPVTTGLARSRRRSFSPPRQPSQCCSATIPGSPSGCPPDRSI